MRVVGDTRYIDIETYSIICDSWRFQYLYGQSLMKKGLKKQEEYNNIEVEVDALFR